MQIVIQVLTTEKRSLRDVIVKDRSLADYGLIVTEILNRDRSHGWSKLKSTAKGHGAINIQWESSSRMLSCRVVTKITGTPDLIIADFIGYLLARFGNVIEAIHILPRR